jgi:dihydrofolate synthase/folylpolyglutamate synthase
MRALVRGLGHPERAFKSVLIAGTNGKGSVSAYLDAALRSASLHVGRYTSPHLIDIRERITVSGRNISNEDFERLVLEVRDCADQLIGLGRIKTHPNHFEILTAVAFLHFQRRGVDIAVLEVGLGGRLDATNVASPEVSAIVSIDFDHEEYLGRTLSTIASEKAGVTRKGRVTVLGPMDAEALRTIVRKARDTGARIVHAKAGVTIKAKPGGLDVKTPAESYRGLRPLPGDHQRANMVVAIRALEALHSAGVPLNLPQGVAAMSGAFWPGRLERFEGRPPVLLDGAHNPAGARALARYLRSAIGPHVLVFGAMRDKHVDEMAEALFPLARLVIATRVRMKRASTTAQLKEIGLRLRVEVIEQPSIGPAIARAAQEAKRGETVVVAGSLYLVGAARKRLLKKGDKQRP